MSRTQILNWSALALTCAIALWRGARPERLGAVIIALGFLITPLVQRRDSWYEPQFGMMAVDAVVLAALVFMTVRYDRHWTIWTAAFQAIGVLTHFAFLVDPHALYRAYYFGNFAMGYLILGALVGGVAIEARRPYRQRPLPWPRPPSGSS